MTGSGRNRVVAAVLAGLVLLVGSLAITGAPSVLVLVAAALPWLVALRARIGGVLAAAATIIVGFLALLLVLLITPLVGTPLLASVEVVVTAVGILGAAALWRTAVPLARPAVVSAVIALPALAGGAIWLGVQLAARVLPGAARLSLVMQGDAANNVLLAREILRDNGVVVGGNNNPVPLPAGFLAVLTASGRGALSSADWLRHDVSALVLAWSLLIALCCLAAGLLTGVVARDGGAHPFVVAIGSAGASILPLAWFISGYAVDYGFLDAELAIPIVLLGFLAYLGGRSHPAVSVALLFCSGTLLLAVWSPLVLLPLALAAIVMVRERAALVRTRGGGRVFFCLAALQLLTFGLDVSLPNLLTFGHVLSTAGAVFHFRNWMVFALAAAAIVLGLVAFRRVQDARVLGTIAVVLASLVGLAVLLFVSRNQPSPWTYYPVKFAWLCSSIVVILIVGLALAAISRFRAVVIQVVGVVAVTAVTLGFLAWAPTAQPGYAAINPSARVLRGEVAGGDTVADYIMSHSDPAKPVVLWHSGNPHEAAINFWVWELKANTLKGKVRLREDAYGYYSHNSISSLCSIVGLLGGSVVVHSKVTGLQGSLRMACPSQDARVVP